MVDFRPLLFANALALMLLVTAGFASVQDDLRMTTTFEPPTTEQVVASAKPMPETRPGPESAPEETNPLTVSSMPENPEVLAVAEPPEAMATRTDTPSTSSEKQTKQVPPTQALLVLRSNVVGDHVTINGKEYGATRLDLELAPGQYEVTISKPGFKPWNRTVELAAGNEMTLVGELEALTTVNFRDGTWIDGVKTGDGTYQDTDGLRYEGHFVDGKFHGQGTAWYPDGSRYEGDWSAGQRDGDGEWRSADGSHYSGEFGANQFNGKGTLTLENGDILTGHWQNGQLNGHGSLTTADGMLYVGDFRNNEFHGNGTLSYPDGRHYEGEFSNGAFNGMGAEVFASGKKYEGEYIEGKFHGKGVLKNPNGSSIEASFRHGKPYGQVRLTTAAGEVFTARTTEPGVCYRDKSYRATECPKLEGW